MKLSQEQINIFQKEYLNSYGVSLTYEEAEIKAIEITQLLKILIKH